MALILQNCKKIPFKFQFSINQFNLFSLLAVSGVIPQGYTIPDHLAIDWVSRNLYWTCPRFRKIYISRLNGSFSMVVIDEDLEEPRGIAVDPGDGLVFQFNVINQTLN